MFFYWPIRRNTMLLVFVGLLGLVGCELPLTFQMAGITLPGDVDGNGRVDIWDARSLDRSLTSSHFRVPFPASADVSQNDEVDRGDFEAIEKRAHGISTIEVKVNQDNQVPVVIGGITAIEVADTFLPLDVKEGSVRISSQATEYDSGQCQLYHESHGRALIYHWNTNGLLPADDYVVEVQLKKAPRTVGADRSSTSSVPPAATTAIQDTADQASAEALLTPVDLPSKGQADIAGESPVGTDPTAAQSKAGSQEPMVMPAAVGPQPEIVTHKLQISLIARARELPLLAQATDLSLPFWKMNLQITRRYCYSAIQEAEISEFGRGWTHILGVRLAEYSDGLIEVLGAGPAAPKFGKSAEDLYKEVAGRPERLVRDPDGSFQLFIDGENIWKFDSSLKPIELHDSQNHSIVFGYENDQLVEISDQAGQSLRLDYEQGVITSITDSLGRTAQYSYDKFQNLVGVNGPAGEYVAYEYDGEHRLTSELRQGVVARLITYHADGLVRSISGEDTIKFEYGVKTIGPGTRSIQTALGRTLHEDITADGRVIARRLGAEGEKVHFEYANDFSVCAMSSLGNTVLSSTPTVDGLQTCLTLPGGAEMTWGQLPEQHATLVTDANGISTTLRYLENGQLTHIQYADGLVETRRYRESPEGTSVECELRSGQTVQYWFDKRGLLQAIQNNRQPKTVYDYDALGNLTKATNDWGTLAFTYDDHSRMITCEYPDGKRIRYEYDDQGRRTSLTGPAGHPVVYSYDNSGRLTTVECPAGQALAEYRYGNRGELVSRQSRNQFTTGFSYSSTGDLDSIVSAGANDQSLNSWSYQYDSLGRKIASKHNGLKHTYEYDPAGRLVQVASEDASEDSRGEAGKQSLQYDAVGNRTSLNAERFATNVLNQYSQVGGSIRTYDLNGNLNVCVQDGQRTAYEHDALNRLIRVRLPNQNVVSYQYDPLGRLATRTVNGHTTRFYWDGDQIISSSSDGGSPQTYVRSGQGNELIAVHRDGKWFFCGQDGLGNITEISDEQGHSVANLKYDCFGHVTASGDLPSDWTFNFAGAFYDSLTQLHHMPNNRWYDADCGAYLEPHGLAAIIGTHPYSYAGGDPLNCDNSPIPSVGGTRLVAGREPPASPSQLLTTKTLAEKWVYRPLSLPTAASLHNQDSPELMLPSPGPTTLLSQLHALQFSR